MCDNDVNKGSSALSKTPSCWETLMMDEAMYVYRWLLKWFLHLLSSFVLRVTFNKMQKSPLHRKNKCLMGSLYQTRLEMDESKSFILGFIARMDSPCKHGIVLLKVWCTCGFCLGFTWGFTCLLFSAQERETWCTLLTICFRGSPKSWSDSLCHNLSWAIKLQCICFF